jgi:beta-barrel assembly-enhancing protease
VNLVSRYEGVKYLISVSVAALLVSCTHGSPDTTASNPSKQGKLTPREEYMLGRKVAIRLLGHYPPKKTKFNRYANVLSKYLASFSIRPTTFKGYRVQLLDSSEMMAISAPGGFIFLSKELVKSVGSEDELAGVIAHEVAHIALRHGEEALRRARKARKSREAKEQAVEGLTELANTLTQEVGSEEDKKNLIDVKNLGESYGGVAGDLFVVLQTSSYNREQEYAADKMAVSILLRAGYDPRKYAKFLARSFSTLDRVKNSKKSPVRLFETHPMDEVRVSRIRSSTKGWIPGPPSKARDQRFNRMRLAALKS